MGVMSVIKNAPMIVVYVKITEHVSTHEQFNACFHKRLTIYKYNNTT